MLSRTFMCIGLAAAIALAPVDHASAQERDNTRGLGAATSSAHTISGTRRALVVGISQYANLPSSQQLQFADDDAEMVYAFLRSPAGGPTEYARLLRDEEATAGVIMQELLTLRDQAQPGDEIIFYFAGHGDVENIGGDQNRGRLLAYDAPGNQLYIGMGGTIPVQTVQDIMEVIVDKGAQVIILTDACRSGSMNSGLEGAQVTAAKLAGTWSNVFRFVSSGANQLSEEDADLGHGVFTYYLLDGLLGAADGLIVEDGVVEATEINLYVTQQVRRRTNDQTPVLTGDPGRVLSTVSPSVTWDTLQQLVPARSETPQYGADRGLAPEEREARLESLNAEQRAAIQQFEDKLNSGELVGGGGAVELYETLRNRVPSSYFTQLGQQLAVALEVQVQELFSTHLSGEMRTDSSGDGDSIWNVPHNDISAAADAMDAALALRGATYISYPTMRSQAGFLRGWAAVVKGEYEEAIELLKDVTPQSAFSLNALGYAYYHNSQPELAAEALAGSVELAPNWAEPVRFQGFVAQYQFEYDTALAFYERAAGVAPNNPFLQVDIGEVHALTDDFEAAMAAWHRALDIDAEAAAPSIANFIMERWVYADREEIAESIYAEAMIRMPNSPSLYVDRGDFYRFYGDLGEAEEDYKQAQRIDADYESAYNGLGLLYEFQERYDEAAEAYSRTAELVPDSPIPWRNLADVYAAQERYTEAIAAYERALANNDEYSAAHMGLGNVYTELEDYEQAERHLRLHAEMSNLSSAWNDLGVFYEIQVYQYEDAIRAYEQARDIAPDDALILANLGDARRKLNTPAARLEAAGAYRAALLLNPASQLAINGLELLEDHETVPRRDRRVEEIPGRLDNTADTFDDGSYYVPHTVHGQAGEEWTILFWSDAFDPYLIVYDDSGGVEIGRDDDSGIGYNAALTVTLPRTGPYTIVANTYSQGEYGNYEIVMLRELPEGQGGGQAQVFTGALTNLSETLDDNSRFEVHFIDANAGEQIEVTVASDAFDTIVYILDVNGELVGQDDDSAGGTNSRVSVTIPTTGEYSLVVNSYEPDAYGDYTMSVRRGGGQVGGGQAGGYTPPTGSSGGGDVLYGTLSAANDRLDDNSPYAIHDVQAQSGETIEITMQSSAFDTYLIVLDPMGNAVAEDDDSGGGTNSRISFTAATSGAYAVFANSYGEDASGAYTINIRRGGGGGGNVGGGAVGSDVLQGTLTSSSDRMGDNTPYEMHFIQAQSGESLEITMQSSAFDTYLMILDSDGNKIGEDDDSGGGTDSRVSVTAPATGMYTIVANAYGEAASGPYTVTVRRGGGGASNGGGGGGGFSGDALAASLGDDLDHGDVVTGALSRANDTLEDDSHFAIHTITVRANETLSFLLTSPNFDTYLYVYTLDGDLLGQDDDSGGGSNGTDSRLTVTVPSDGVLFVVANGYDENSLGTYTLTVDRGPQGDAL